MVRFLAQSLTLSTLLGLAATAGAQALAPPILSTGYNYIKVGSDKIENTEMPFLRALAAKLKAYPGYKSVTVEGHTDSQGDPEYNKILSRHRAEHVKKVLIAMGIPARKIAVNGVGAVRPIADNSTEVGRQINRRIEFKVEWN